MSAKWNPKQHPRDGENGRFTRNWEARLADQIEAAIRRGDMSRQYTPTTERPTSARPISGQRGYIRIGDRPDRAGAADGIHSWSVSPSTHPEAGGVWIDPARPGTNHAPTFRNDFGSAISDLRKAPSRSERHKENVQARRTEDWSGTGDRDRRLPEDGGKIGRRLEGAPAAAVKEMRRAQARARREGSYREPTRRTPRGTQVDSWMSKVNERIEKGTRRG
jgi:hypothetical protein